MDCTYRMKPLVKGHTHTLVVSCRSLQLPYLMGYTRPVPSVSVMAVIPIKCIALYPRHMHAYTGKLPSHAHVSHMHMPHTGSCRRAELVSLLISSWAAIPMERRVCIGDFISHGCPTRCHSLPMPPQPPPGVTVDVLDSRLDDGNPSAPLATHIDFSSVDVNVLCGISASPASAGACSPFVMLLTWTTTLVSPSGQWLLTYCPCVYLTSSE